jgi:hypothetical protein
MHLQQNKTVSSVPLSSDIKRGATFLGTREKRIVRDSDEKNDHLIFAQEISSRLEKQRDQMQVTIGTSDREGTRSKLKITRTIFGQSAELHSPHLGFQSLHQLSAVESPLLCDLYHRQCGGESIQTKNKSDSHQSSEEHEHELWLEYLRHLPTSNRSIPCDLYHKHSGGQSFHPDNFSDSLTSNLETGRRNTPDPDL